MNIGSGDVVDRLSILLLKCERAEEKPIEEHGLYMEEYINLRNTYSNFDWDLFLEIAQRVNGIIWDLESALRSAQLDNDPTEVGKRAILIRKINGVRVGIKNLINSLTGQGFKEVKHKDHLSR